MWTIPVPSSSDKIRRPDFMRIHRIFNNFNIFKILFSCQKFFFTRHIFQRQKPNSLIFSAEFNFIFNVFFTTIWQYLIRKSPRFLFRQPHKPSPNRHLKIPASSSSQFFLARQTIFCDIKINIFSFFETVCFKQRAAINHKSSFRQILNFSRYQSHELSFFRCYFQTTAHILSNQIRCVPP